MGMDGRKKRVWGNKLTRYSTPLSRQGQIAGLHEIQRKQFRKRCLLHRIPLPVPAIAVFIWQMKILKERVGERLNRWTEEPKDHLMRFYLEPMVEE